MVEESSASNMTREFSTLPTKCDEENGGPVSSSAENRAAAGDSITDNQHQCTDLPHTNQTQREKPCWSNSKRGTKIVAEFYATAKNEVSSGKFDYTTHTTTCNEENDSRTICSQSFNCLEKRNTTTNKDESHLYSISPSITEENVLKTHSMTLNSGNYYYVCHVCSQSFSSERYLKVHITFHKNKGGQSLTPNNSLKRPAIVHAERKPYSCSICSQSFTLKSRLDRHFMVHTNEKPFSCSICVQSFARRDSLIRHIRRTHNHERRFSCSTCGRSYADKRNLKIHIMTYNDEKPFSITRSLSLAQSAVTHSLQNVT